MSKQSAKHVRLQVEALEPRTVPAGNVTASLLAGDLVVRGDNADNAVEIRVIDGNLVVQGRDGSGTTVNGAGRAVFNGVGGVAGRLNVILGGGSDLLDVAGVGVGRDVSIDADDLGAFIPPGLPGGGGLVPPPGGGGLVPPPGGGGLVPPPGGGLAPPPGGGGGLVPPPGGGGLVPPPGGGLVPPPGGGGLVPPGGGGIAPPGLSGADRILLDQLAIGGSVVVATGNGDDAVLLSRSTVAGHTTIVTDSGHDRVSLVGLGLGENLTLDTGAGNDKAFLTGTVVGGPTRIVMDSGSDNLIFHGVSPFSDSVFLDGGRGRDRAEIDADIAFAGGLLVRRFETVANLAVTEFIAAEGLAVRQVPLGDPPGTGSSVFARNGANFAGGEITFFGIPPAYASAPTTYVTGPAGSTITFDRPVAQVRFFFVHFPGAPMGTATAYDAAGRVVAVAQSTQTTFIGDPGNFVTLAGKRPIARVVINGGMIDNVSSVR